MRTLGWLVVAGVVGGLGGGRWARADGPPNRELHAGVNLRSDQGTHQVRLELGGRLRRVEASVVLDPLAARDGQADLDVLLTRWSGARQRLGLFAGWRTSSYSVIGGSLWHQKLLVGALARLPMIGNDRFRFVGGIELCAEVVRHGDMIETEWFDYRSGRHFGDLVNFSLFVRAELAVGN